MLTSIARIDEGDGPDEIRAKIVGPIADAADAVLVAERLAQLLGIPGAEAAPDETHWAVRKFLEAAAASRPLIASFDDLQWAETNLLDLIEYVAYWSNDAPMLLLCTARPELLEHRPGWGGGTLEAISMTLEPLSDPESERLVANLLRQTLLPEESVRRITEAAEGQPSVRRTDGGRVDRRRAPGPGR